MNARAPRALWLTLAVAYGFALVPIWAPRLLPLLDLPNHLAAIQIWNRLDDPAWGFDHYYRYSRVPVPYWGYYFPVHLLSRFFSLEAANKIFLSAYAAALPLSAVAFARRFGRSPWLALLTFPLVFSHSFGWGFLSYVPGIPLVLFGLAALSRFLDEPSAARWGGLFALLLATWFMHVVPWALLGAGATLLVLAHARRRRAAWAAAGALALSLALAIADTIYCSRTGRVVGRRIYFQGGFESAWESIRNFPARLIMRWPDGHGAEWVLGALALTLVLLAATARWEPESARAPDGSAMNFIARHFPEVFFAVALLGYLLLPVSLAKPAWIWYLNVRLAPVVALAALFLIRRPIRGARLLLLAPALAAAIYFPLALNARFRQFNYRAAGLLRLLDRVPRGASTLTLMLGINADPALDPDLVPFNEFYSYPTVLRGGYNPYGWSFGFPFEKIDGAALPAPSWLDFRKFDQATEGAFYDFVITRDEAVPRSIFGPLAPRVPLVAIEGAWKLYATRGVR